MRRTNTLSILTLMFGWGGLGVAALAMFRGDPLGAGGLWSASKLLLMLAAAGGWLGLIGLRRDCRALAEHLDAARTGKPLPQIKDADPALLPLAAAVGHLLVEPQPARKQDTGPCLQSADAKALAAKVRELEIRLKVAEAERGHAEAVLYSISDGVLVTGRSDEVVLANESAARTFRFDLASAQGGRTPLDAVLRDPGLVRLIREMRGGAGQAPGGRRVVEHHVQTPGGSRTFKVTLAPLAGATAAATDLPAPHSAADANPATGPAGVVAVLRDVTRDKEVVEMKNDFVSLVSHELRTPLASIKAYVEMLIDGEAVDEKTTREFYEVIQNEANRLGRLIDNILNVSRIESGLMKADRRPVSLAAVVRQAADSMLLQAQQKGVRLVQELADAPDRTSADPDMIHQAVVNLLTNAVKFTPEGGTIRVETRVDAAAGTVTARVSDTGVGIPPKDLPFVFDKFFRSEDGSRVACGTGLGLALVKHIVETVHGGKVFVQSEVGKGSCFGFELQKLEESGVRGQESGTGPAV